MENNKIKQNIVRKPESVVLRNKSLSVMVRNHNKKQQKLIEKMQDYVDETTALFNQLSLRMDKYENQR